MSLTLRRIAQGASFEILALGREGTYDALEFLESQARVRRADTDGMLALLDAVAERGFQRYAISVTRKLDGPIFEFKYGLLRVLWFYDTRRRGIIIATHGWLKGPKREQQAQIRLALKRYAEYQDAGTAVRVEE